jgi:hypothetical protein
MDPATIGLIAKVGIPLVAGLFGKKGGDSGGGQAPQQKQIQQDPFLPSTMQRQGQQGYQNTQLGMTDNPYFQQFLASQMGQMPNPQMQQMKPQVPPMQRF